MGDRSILSDAAHFVGRHIFTIAACGAFALALASNNSGHSTAALSFALAGASALLLKHGLLDGYSSTRVYAGGAGGLAAGAAVSVACGLGGLPAGAIIAAGTAIGAFIGSSAIEDRSFRGIYNFFTVPVKAKIQEWKYCRESR